MVQRGSGSGRSEETSDSGRSEEPADSTLVLGPAPHDAQRDRVVVGPGAVVVFDGDRHRLSLIVTVITDGCRRSARFGRAALQTILQTVDRELANGATMVWLRDREWLVEHLGPFVVKLEIELSAVAAARNVPFVAWTGTVSGREATELSSPMDDVYGAIVDHAPASVLGRASSGP